MPIRPSFPFPPEPAVRFSAAAFLAFFVLCLAVNWPGRLNEDSLEQFIGFYNPAQLGDVHSPLIAYLWGLPAPFLAQPAAALVVQSALLAFFAAMLPSPFPRRGVALVHAAGEGAVKLSLVVLAGFVIKDVLLVGLLLAGLTCLQRAGVSPRPARWLAGAACLFALSLAVRPTNFVMMAFAALAIVPLIVRTWRGRAAALGIAFAVLLITLPLSAAFNAYVVKARKDRAEIQLILFDLVGISARSGRDLVRELPRWPAGLPDPRGCYTPSEAAIMAPWSPCRGYSEAGRRAYSAGRRRVLAVWLRSIAEHPGAYVAHRLDFTRNLLDPVGAARGHPIYAAAAKDAPARFLYALNQPSAAHRLAASTQGRIDPGRFLLWEDNPAARGFATLSSLVVGFRSVNVAALLVSLFLLGWTWARHLRERPLPPLTVPAAAALAAGNFVMHAFLGVASQARYLHPTIFCAAFAVLVALRYALDARSSPSVQTR
jgi:hypothetical protein